MEQQVAVRLISPGIDRERKGQIWTDLGAGGGTFTRALASLLDDSSKIFAIDKNSTALNQIGSVPGGALISTIESDFVSDKLTVPLLHGVLLANSLHYVDNKSEFLKSLKTKLVSDGRMIIVEYDTLKANAWVPYPVNFNTLNDIVRATGFRSVTKIGEEPSKFRTGNLYAALVR